MVRNLAGLVPALLLVAPALAADPLAVDIPSEIRKWYRNPDGSCVQCSIGMCGVDQNVPQAATLLWDTEYGPRERGGSGPSRVAGYCDRRGIRAFNITGKTTFDWMKWACRNGRGAAIGAGSAHFQTLMGYDPHAGKWYVCNNNSPDKVDEYDEAGFRRLHLASGQWIVVLDYPPHPARPEYVRWWTAASDQCSEDTHQRREGMQGLSMVGLLTLLALAPSDPSQVDQDEVRRLGNLVQRVGDGKRANAEVDGFVEALGPPADDADKWFISVISMRGCPGCTTLKRDWASDSWLRALAIPDDPKQSWAHYNVFDKDDVSQAFRWEKIKIAAFPTILVQPPRSGKYGDPGVVVYQGVYSGDPHQLATAITTAIRRYVATLPQPRMARGHEQCPNNNDVRPPWRPAPKDDPNVAPPVVRPHPFDTINIPPEPQLPRPLQTAQTMSSVGMFMAGVSVPAAIALIVIGLRYIRERRQETGKPTLLDDQTFNQMLQLLQLLSALKAKDTNAAEKSETTPQ